MVVYKSAIWFADNHTPECQADNENEKYQGKASKCEHLRAA
jgi:hypothetical protein